MAEVFECTMQAGDRVALLFLLGEQAGRYFGPTPCRMLDVRIGVVEVETVAGKVVDRRFEGTAWFEPLTPDDGTG